MNNSKKIITRRDFIRTGSYVAMGSLMGLPWPGQAAGTQTTESRVVLIRDKNLMDASGNLRSVNLAEMLDQAMQSLFDAGSPSRAWQQLFNAQDIVGIKSNVWWHLPTPSALEEILQERLMEAGVQKQNIGVDDRGGGAEQSGLYQIDGPDQCSSNANPCLVGVGNTAEKLHHVCIQSLDVSWQRL